MKKIPLKKVPVSRSDGSEAILDYKEQLEFIVKVPRDAKVGMDINEIRGALRVLEALEKTEEDWVDFEDADYNFLMEKVRVARFGIVHPAIVQFVDDVTGAG